MLSWNLNIIVKLRNKCGKKFIERLLYFIIYLKLNINITKHQQPNIFEKNNIIKSIIKLNNSFQELVTGICFRNNKKREIYKYLFLDIIF